MINVLLLITALVISAISGYVSIVGWTSIFAGALITAIAMFSSLEIAKLSIASWLYRFWNKTHILMKTYMLSALIVLMVITSVGVFGFLSKSHIDQALPAQTLHLKLDRLNQQIESERSAIAQAEQKLKIMDTAVAALLGKEDKIERGANTLDQQRKERRELQQTLKTAVSNIDRLNTEKVQILDELKDYDAKIGPIKYIAEAFMGSNIDPEKAVQWIIILIVMVFDPLAIVMLVGANQQFMNREKELTEQKVDVSISDVNSNQTAKENKTNMISIIKSKVGGWLGYR